MSDTVSTEDGPVTFVNVFEIPHEDVDAFKAGWRQRAELIATAPGFRDAQLLEASSTDSRFQLINVAHWDSEQAWRDAMENAEIQEAIRRVSADPQQRATPNIGLYRPVATIPPGR